MSKTTPPTSDDEGGLFERTRDVAHLFAQAPGMLVILHGPEHVVEVANAAYVQLVGGRKLIGKRLREAVPELEGQGYFELLDEVYAKGEPFTGRSLPVDVRRGSDGALERRFFDFVYQPIRNLAGQMQTPPEPS